MVEKGNPFVFLSSFASEERTCVFWSNRAPSSTVALCIDVSSCQISRSKGNGHPCHALYNSLTTILYIIYIFLYLSTIGFHWSNAGTVEAFKAKEAASSTSIYRTEGQQIQRTAAQTSTAHIDRQQNHPRSQHQYLCLQHTPFFLIPLSSTKLCNRWYGQHRISSSSHCFLPPV